MAVYSQEKSWLGYSQVGQKPNNSHNHTNYHHSSIYDFKKNWKNFSTRLFFLPITDGKSQNPYKNCGADVVPWRHIQKLAE